MKLWHIKHPSARAEDIASTFALSASGAGHWLKQLGSSYKKTYSYVEASGEKRSAYQEVIKDVPTQNMVHIDESGIELTI